MLPIKYIKEPLGKGLEAHLTAFSTFGSIFDKSATAGIPMKPY